MISILCLQTSLIKMAEDLWQSMSRSRLPRALLQAMWTPWAFGCYHSGTLGWVGTIPWKIVVLLKTKCLGFLPLKLTWTISCFVWLINHTNTWGVWLSNHTNINEFHILVCKFLQHTFPFAKDTRQLRAELELQWCSSPGRQKKTKSAMFLVNESDSSTFVFIWESEPNIVSPWI